MGRGRAKAKQTKSHASLSTADRQPIWIGYKPSWSVIRTMSALRSPKKSKRTIRMPSTSTTSPTRRASDLFDCGAVTACWF